MDGSTDVNRPCAPEKVSRPEVIEARFRIPFFAGITRPCAGIVQASGQPGDGVGDSKRGAEAEGGVWNVIA